jgi:GH25 family lysozyme M1 (1,4-beta-N-acetylmuramidase)
MKLTLAIITLITYALVGVFLYVVGFDVNDLQGSVDWRAAVAEGGKFAYIKATGGINSANPRFGQQYASAQNAGLFHGAYHLAEPASTSGAAQANYFFAHGGAWSADGKSLPGALDLEYGPKGQPCHGLSQNAMINWINDFSNTYHGVTG